MLQGVRMVFLRDGYAGINIRILPKYIKRNFIELYNGAGYIITINGLTTISLIPFLQIKSIRNFYG